MKLKDLPPEARKILADADFDDLHRLGCELNGERREAALKAFPTDLRAAVVELQQHIRRPYGFDHVEPEPYRALVQIIVCCIAALDDLAADDHAAEAVQWNLMQAERIARALEKQDAETSERLHAALRIDM